MTDNNRRVLSLKRQDAAARERQMGQVGELLAEIDTATRNLISAIEAGTDPTAIQPPPRRAPGRRTCPRAPRRSARACGTPTASPRLTSTKVPVFNSGRTAFTHIRERLAQT